MLNYNDILFTESDHTYIDGKGVEYSGITSVLSAMIFADKYNDVPAYILDKAAEHGSWVHEQLQHYDMFGVAEECEELTQYNELKQKLNIIPYANEYLVSDGVNFATKIDMLDTHLNMYDYKTTAKLDLEYIRWQLSICAYLFELQNPHLKAGKLYAIWLRNQKAELHEVDRISSTLVLELLTCYLLNQPFTATVPAVTESNEVQQVIDIERFILTVEQQLKQAKDTRSEMLKRIKDEMTKNNCSSLESDNIKITIIKPYTRIDIDKARLKEEYPDICELFRKEIEVKESIKITLKKR